MLRSISSIVTLVAVATLTAAGMQPGGAAAAPTGPGDRAAPDVRTARTPAAPPRRVSLTKNAQGYYYSAWGSDNRITVTLVGNRLHFRDTHVIGWTRLARQCRKERVARGVSASCRVPASVSVGHPLVIKLEMRLGNDYVDTRTLPAQFSATVLADQGKEEVHTGDGDDFINGAFQRDRIWAGEGNDWVRSGEADDLVFGEGGKDHLVGGESGDVVHGGDGNDLLEGGPGDDNLYGEAGADEFKCNDGNDATDNDPADTQRFGCERFIS